MNHRNEVLIVGAGITGLMAAQALTQVGRRVTIVDKGRSVGGRLATRRIGPGLADHGAQFFTVRTPAFAAQVQRWEAAGLVFRWATGWSDGSIAGPVVDGHPRYAVRGGMNSLAKALAADLTTAGVPIHLDVKLTIISAQDDGWCATDEQGNDYVAATAILTAPVPQTLALLDAGAVKLTPGQRGALESVRYAPCLCGMAWVEGAVQLPEPGAVQKQDAPIAWVADNRRKGISPDAQTITFHANPVWSAAHYADSDEEVAAVFAAELKRWAYGDYRLRELQVKRWRYALPTALYPQPFLLAEGLAPLYLGGDAFATPRVEGAASSGLAIAAHIHGDALWKQPESLHDTA
jgi:predicted NAD/FAD-dependent oxidoreductase